MLNYALSAAEAVIRVLALSEWGDFTYLLCLVSWLFPESITEAIKNVHNDNHAPKCEFFNYNSNGNGAESFVFQFAIKKAKDQDI